MDVYMPNTSQNARLNKLLAVSEASLDRARSKEDLLEVIQEFASYNGPLKFNYTSAWWFFGTGMVLSASTVALYGYLDSRNVASFF